VAAILPVPANKAITGVIQQREAANAETRPAPANLLVNFRSIILLQVFEFVY
jgi:hypothetical protein